MLGSRSSRDVVTCIACGESVSRSDAREYDKHGDRWDRTDKEFEYLCKPCHSDLTHQPRPGLEDLLETVEADADDRDSFLRRYVELAEEKRR
ncbi:MULTISPECIES: DUF7562 family protein [Halomicrobium]|uniref:Small CPxCG-related zinc finger protein n=2 Tax=Halomicrobium mukohataei TaxID=57705 RepID=C7NX43_HALMD|nr:MULTISPECIES: hypothetical protein [Halomicrobium]ACV46408.1 conserved hypothetical protein [Halomicrobium mukohataei DSM 12286]QCD64960.1 hypothetical protein E5139_04650 [Halomicrobium mukohataei]QFR19766.1 hypothetical protein GBQ70_04645 [Halomicrobium sp. ZPS1]